MFLKSFLGFLMLEHHHCNLTEIHLPLPSIFPYRFINPLWTLPGRIFSPFHWSYSFSCFEGRNQRDLCVYFLFISPQKELHPAKVGTSGQFQLFLYIYMNNNIHTYNMYIHVQIYKFFCFLSLQGETLEHIYTK